MGISSRKPVMYRMTVRAWRRSAAITGSVPTSPGASVSQ
jgi:hypothetical protein